MSVKSWVNRADGSFFKLFSNKVLLFNRQYKYLGTRVYGAISKEVKSVVNSHSEKKHIQKIFSYTSLII